MSLQKTNLPSMCVMLLSRLQYACGELILLSLVLSPAFVMNWRVNAVFDVNHESRKFATASMNLLVSELLYLALLQVSMMVRVVNDRPHY